MARMTSLFLLLLSASAAFAGGNTGEDKVARLSSDSRTKDQDRRSQGVAFQDDATSISTGAGRRSQIVGFQDDVEAAEQDRRSQGVAFQDDATSISTGAGRRSQIVGFQDDVEGAEQDRRSQGVGFQEDSPARVDGPERRTQTSAPKTAVTSPTRQGDSDAVTRSCAERFWVIDWREMSWCWLACGVIDRYETRSTAGERVMYTVFVLGFVLPQYTLFELLRSTAESSNWTTPSADSSLSDETILRSARNTLQRVHSLRPLEAQRSYSILANCQLLHHAHQAQALPIGRLRLILTIMLLLAVTGSIFTTPPSVHAPEYIQSPTNGRFWPCTRPAFRYDEQPALYVSQKTFVLVVGKQPTTPILLSATSIGCKPLDPRTAGAPATSASSRKHSTLFVENSGRPETRIIGRSDAGERPVKTAQMCGKRSKERDGNRGSVSGEFSVYISSPSSSILSATGLATPTSVSPSTAPILRASAQRSLASTTSLFPPPSAPALIPSPAPLTSPPFSACTRRGVLPPALLNRVHEASHTLAQLPIDSHAARLPSFISSRAATDAFALASTTAPQSAVHSVDAAHALPCAPAVPNGTHEASLAPEQVHGAPDHSVFASASAQQSAARRADSSPALLAPPSVPKISVVSGPPSNAEVVVARAPISMLPFHRIHWALCRSR
ncbi:hypothetical protein B0H13DRAFT_1889221 [Mycena leptocephala]|nr:hypothetical protein B0H13DRAFT_1889221 [Mycena leptocephala]